MSCESIINLFFCIIVCGLIPICIIEFQFRDPTELFIPKISITLILIGFVIWYFSNEDNNEYNGNYDEKYDDNIYYNNKNRSYNYNYMINKSYCQKTDMNAYDKITKENTERELDKLRKTNAFREMYMEKGDDMNNWNWQSRERMQRESLSSYCCCF